VDRLVLVSLIVFVISVVGGLAAAAVQGLSAWRAFRRLQHAAMKRLAEATAELARLERRSAEATAAAARLDQARVRLQESLSTAAILSAAAGEAWSLAGRVRGVVPRK
jgi:type II secretory pathway pseudopilin PulG